MAEPPAGDERGFPLLAATRWVAPLAVAFGIVGALLGYSARGRLLLGGGALLIAAFAVVARLRRPLLMVSPTGYRVVETGRERLRVAFTEVRRARAVPEEQAMYLDTGDPARNLLLPTRHGFGFRFARQPELYVLLAQRLGERIEIVKTLIPDEKEKQT